MVGEHDAGGVETRLSILSTAVFFDPLCMRKIYAECLRVNISMATTSRLAALDFDQFVEQYHLAVNEFAKGDPEPVNALLSHEDEVSLAGGFGGCTRGFKQVTKNIEFAATQFKEGEVNFEGLTKVVTKEMGYIVEIERYNAKLGGSADVIKDALRVTSIFRREEGSWKLVHRHGDVTTAMLALVRALPVAVVSIQKAV